MKITERTFSPADGRPLTLLSISNYKYTTPSQKFQYFTKKIHQKAYFLFFLTYFSKNIIYKQYFWNVNDIYNQKLIKKGTKNETVQFTL